MKRGQGNGSVVGGLIVVALFIAGTVGWGKCVYKTCQCNWEPIGKAEIFYTIGSFTGTGAIIGYIDIEDK